MKNIQLQWTFPLQASPEKLWPFLSNTNQMNFDLGLPAISSPPTAGTLWNGDSRFWFQWWGLSVEWEESPFEWSDGQSMKVSRRYLRGPVRQLRVELTLAPHMTGTIVTYHIEIEPAHPAAACCVQTAIFLVAKPRLTRLLYQYDHQALAVNSALVAPDHYSSVNRERLKYYQHQLEETSFSSSGVKNLLDYIERASDLDLVKMRPLALAKKWHLTKPEAIQLFLQATRLGVLNLQWDLLCPLCRGAKGRFQSLSLVNPSLHCDTCQIDFTINFDRLVELTFTPHANVRALNALEYCMGSPQRTPHIVMQSVLRPGEKRELTCPKEEGHYRLRTLQSTHRTLLQIEENGESEKTLHLTESGWRMPNLKLIPEAKITVQNETQISHVIIVERTAWSDDALTAAEATSLQIFRDFFSSEVLKHDVEISVGNLAIVFTDLKESTRLYRRLGDATAFGRVMTHFEVLKEAVRQEEGTLVKTIGDSVMAVFFRPVCALRALVQVQKKIAAMGLSLKAGLHAGACMAVNLNERLDYFGSTVNIAARLGSLSSGENVVISSTIFNDPDVQSWLKSYPEIRYQPLEASLKGLENESFSLYTIHA